MPDIRKVLLTACSVLFLLLNSRLANAQEESVHHLSIYAGGSLPLGDFSSTTSSHAGFAQLGFDGGLEYSLRLHRLFEIGILGNISINGTDEDALRRVVAGISSNTSGGTWYLYGLLLSAGIADNVSQSVGLHGRVYAGLIEGDAAELTLYNIFASGGYVTQKSAWGSAFGYGLGAGATLNSTWDFTVRYLMAEPNYDTELTDGTTVVKVKFKQPSAILLLTLGLVLK